MGVPRLRTKVPNSLRESGKRVASEENLVLGNIDHYRSGGMATYVIEHQGPITHVQGHFPGKGYLGENYFYLVQGLPSLCVDIGEELHKLLLSVVLYKLESPISNSMGDGSLREEGITKDVVEMVISAYQIGDFLITDFAKLLSPVKGVLG